MLFINTIVLFIVFKVEFWEVVAQLDFGLLLCQLQWLQQSLVKFFEVPIKQPLSIHLLLLLELFHFGVETLAVTHSL